MVAGTLRACPREPRPTRRIAGQCGALFKHPARRHSRRGRDVGAPPADAVARLRPNLMDPVGRARGRRRASPCGRARSARASPLHPAGARSPVARRRRSPGSSTRPCRPGSPSATRCRRAREQVTCAACRRVAGTSSSTSTATACGTSSRVRFRAASRTSSPIRSRTGSPEEASTGYSAGPSSANASSSSRIRSTPSAVRADTGTRAAKSPSSAIRSIAPPIAAGDSRSILFTASTTGVPEANTRPAMNRSPAPGGSVPSSTNRIASTSASVSSTVRCIRPVRPSRGVWNPGRSSSTSCQLSPFSTPATRRRVVCGLSDTIETWAPQSAFTSVDFPTFGRPATPIRAERNGSLTGGSAPAGSRRG